MDYVVGNVAALISGNVTPSRPKLSKRALTPIKHMPSPNVTPKSELVDDRSIFLSPSVQKKKAIVKKSPKRIFQNPDLDVTNENEGNTSTNSPKADKVKKHLKGELEGNVSIKNKSKAAVTPEDMNSKPVKSPSPKKKKKGINGDLNGPADNNVSSNEFTLKKKKKHNSVTEVSQSVESNEGAPKKTKKQKGLAPENVQIDTQEVDVNTSVKASKKKKNKKKPKTAEPQQIEEPQDDVNSEHDEMETTSPKKKNKKRKQKVGDTQEENDSAPSKNKKIKVNPNAITDKDSDSEHESDNEIESETEETNKEVLENSAPAEPSSDEEEEDVPKPKKKKKAASEETEKVTEVNMEEENKRTLFVGNVPFSKKCKKEIKKIFSYYGEIESIRIRTVPVKDPSVTPKLAVIKQELHPERTTVNVYVKFADPESADKAIIENNTLLGNNHLRVTRCGSTGADHDPRHSVFVGNIPFALEDEGLRDKFQACGEIQSVRIVRDKTTNAGKGFGYVNFTSRDGVELALALTEEDLTIKNRIMRVKRCTQATDRQKLANRPGFQGKNKVSQGDRQRNQAATPQGRNFNQGGRFQGNRGGNNFQGNRGGHSQGSRGGGFQGSRGGGFQGSRGGGFQGSRGGGFQGSRGGGFQGSRGGGFQGSRGGGFQGNRGGGFQGNRGGNVQNRGGNSFGKQNDGEIQDGAYRRLKQKRKGQEGGEGPPSKMARDDQPREKKARKEFVGMTAEKKKKRKFDKGQKKKKVLSEILTK